MSKLYTIKFLGCTDITLHLGLIWNFQEPSIHLMTLEKLLKE